MSRYDLEAIRKKMREASTGRRVDPDEFRPAKAPDEKIIAYYFYILGPLYKGDKCKGGTCSRGMDNFFITYGEHWVNKNPYTCPRIHDGSECEMCSIGFELLKKYKGQQTEEANTRRKQINDAWMPSVYHKANIFIPNIPENPEELRGKVRYYNAPKSIAGIWAQAVAEDSPGLAEDPHAYGMVFDEYAAFMFALKVHKKGTNNNYDKSHFLANGGRPRPIVARQDGTPHEEAIQAILGARIDLWSKIEPPNSEKIRQCAKALTDGDDMPSRGSSSGFDVDESAKGHHSQAPANPPANQASSLSNEIPFDMKMLHEAQDKPIESMTRSEKPAPVQAPSPTPSPAPASSPTPVASSVTDDDISALLRQLQEE